MLALYRKYRPKKLSDIVGQETIVAILKNAAREHAFAHAYLFYGPRGTGKTTIARLLAKTINCQKRAEDETFKKEGEPCNGCSTCAQIDTGHALDVVEIDAASNRGIDEIRDLREHIRTLPSVCAKKVFIIDEVHMLTTPAFNALLKTLEEPPAHAIFILATTEYEKVPSTIVSRTQRFHFRKLTLEEIANKLERIARQEQLNYTRDALELLAHLADGSVRDAESLLDQIASMKQKNVSVEHVESVLGKVDFAKTVTMADALIQKDLNKALLFLHTISNDGYNLFQFNKDVTEYLRRTLSLSLNPTLETLFSQEIAHSQLTHIKQHAEKVNSDYLIALIKALIEAYTQMRYNPFPLVPFEIAIIETLK
ncbi:MAG: DNA polymerase III subunit gamma/tau [Candidatus Pacebacteria bacterium]|nr:DNA polymerase III subunit gamma/tau [Candidatus Paceibacterota bacterium]